MLTITYDTERILAINRSRDPANDVPILSAGLIDAQVNGFRGHDVNAADGTSGTIQEITAELAKVGVTTWVPTIITASENSILAALGRIEQARKADVVVANAIPSVHIEGPFISDQDGPRGVHDADQIRPIDSVEVSRWQSVGARIGVVTVSPHAADAVDQIAKLCSLGITVAIGHTHATPEQIIAAVDAGATLSTHLGNGIESYIRRHPNPIWTQLADDRLTCGLIADGHHLPGDTLEVMLRAKGPDKAFLVSDATALAGHPPGLYETAVGGVVDLNAEGRLSYVGTDFLAGAAASLADGLRNVLQVTTAGLPQALRLVTENPARIIPGARPGLGRLRVGAPSDFVLLTENGEVLKVVQSGKNVSRA
ncbi:N-acetylglucosamine-6-phosphate deacetylase [Arthrobacter sp. PAMC 25486]|uniref:N-acetylglucosamine-6-phosphate deacetylase n=1 Tax=Arthrobacter sp. PAMC 25486 TaxID=1494608 RepID=UPI0012FEB1CC|nr:amidohydrolase family protein [Arthrobacter sp. PAMC 25486]